MLEAGDSARDEAERASAAAAKARERAEEELERSTTALEEAAAQASERIATDAAAAIGAGEEVATRLAAAESELRHRMTVAEAQLEAGRRIVLAEGELESTRAEFAATAEAAIARLRSEAADRVGDLGSPAAIESLRRAYREVEALLSERSRAAEVDLAAALADGRDALAAERSTVQGLLEAPATRTADGLDEATGAASRRVAEVERLIANAGRAAKTALDADCERASQAIAEAAAGAEKELGRADDALATRRRMEVAISDLATSFKRAS